MMWSYLKPETIDTLENRTYNESTTEQFIKHGKKKKCTRWLSKNEIVLKKIQLQEM